MLWSLKVAVVGALIFVVLEFVLQLSGILLANFTGSLGMDTSRPMWFIFYLGMWVVSFAIAYSLFPRFVRM
ncbi:MAG: hypothetical protein JWN42_2619 [Candidatus Angelobacter sp.]|nr:hypothetical protein [Candidatus Angelobacter sp.]